MNDFDRAGPSKTWNIQSIPHRSPEVHYRATPLTVAIDVWSIAIMWAQIAGEFITNVNDVSELGQAWVLYCGMPCNGDVKYLQLHKAPAATASRTWSSRTAVALGTSGVNRLKQLLVYSPMNRPSCRAALEHPYFNPEIFPLFGVPLNENRRRTPPMTTGTMTRLIRSRPWKRTLT